MKVLYEAENKKREDNCYMLMELDSNSYNCLLLERIKQLLINHTYSEVFISG